MSLRHHLVSSGAYANAIQKGAVMIHYQDRWAVVTVASSGLGRGSPSDSRTEACPWC